MVGVIDAIALQQVQVPGPLVLADPFLLHPYPGGHRDRRRSPSTRLTSYAYIGDKAIGEVYVIDIRPSSPHYDQVGVPSTSPMPSTASRGSP